MKKTLAHLATRIFNTPLLVHPAKAAVILHAIGPRLGLGLPADALPMADVGDGPDDDPDGDYANVGGIAVISVQGTLVKKSTGMDAMSGLTSYADLTEQIEGAITDPAVKGLVLDIDSPGGEAAGMFDLAEFIYQMRAEKPIFAVANDSAYSAAYCLASAATRLYVTPDGGVGSIGCYMLHVDQSGMDKMRGLNFEYVFAGDKKVDGNPHVPLSASALADIQAQVDGVRDRFVSAVARNRNLTADAVLNTQAGCLYAQDAIPLLADKLGNLDDAIGDMAQMLGITIPDDDEGAEDDVPLSLPTDDSMSAKAIPPQKTATSEGARESAGSKFFGSHGEAGILSVAALFSAKNKFGERVFEGHSFAGCHASISDSDRSISMLVVPYGSISSDLGGFREVYERGCFADGLNEDPRVLFNHDSSMVLGRKSAGTARFWEDAAGVHVDCEAPETQWANDLLVSMRRGDITQASAAFWIVKYRWEQRNGERTRVVERAVMREASVETFPAYESASATVQPAAEASDLHELELAGARLQLLRSR